MRSLMPAALPLALLLGACGPKPPPVKTPPVTRASLKHDGKVKVQKGLTMVDEIEEIRASVDRTPDIGPAAPKPDPLAISGIDAELKRAREIKEELIPIREELYQYLERVKDPPSQDQIEHARAIMARIDDKVGQIRDCRNRAVELKPKPPEPPKEEKKPAEKKK